MLNIPTLGQPVAWCISDREDSVAMETFLRAVKERSPDCEVNVVMTDDGMLMHMYNYIYALASNITNFFHIDNTGWSAAQRVFGNPHHLLCHWHVDQ